MTKLPPAASRMLSIVAVAARLDVSTKTVRRAIKAGDLRVHRIGRLYRITEEDLHLYAAQRRE